MTLDTNVAVYALTDDPGKAEAARAIVERVDFISVQVLNEVANVLTRKRQVPWQVAAAKLTELQDAVPEVFPATLATHNDAIRLAQRYKLGVYDAHIIAVALSGGATTLYSEDMQHGLVIEDTLRIENPFT